jgi:hypothetical protein
MKDVLERNPVRILILESLEEIMNVNLKTIQMKALFENCQGK